MRKILLIIISLLVTVVVDAQTLVGFNGYYTFTKLSTDTTKLNRMQTYESGFGGGVAIKHFELGPVGLQAEFNYEKSAFGFKNDTLGIDYHQDLSYVSVPLLMQVDIGKHFFHVVGTLGPYVNILLSAPEAKTNMETVMMNGFNKMYKADFNRFSYGLMGDVGVAFATKVGVFQVTGRAYIGMSKLLHFEGISLFNYTLPKSYGISVHYFVPFGENAYATKKEKADQDTIVSDLEILSDSLNTVSDSSTVVSPDKSAKKDKKEKAKKDKKSKSDTPSQKSQPEEPVTDKPEQENAEMPDNKIDTNGDGTE